MKSLTHMPENKSHLKFVNCPACNMSPLHCENSSNIIAPKGVVLCSSAFLVAGDRRRRTVRSDASMPRLLALCTVFP